MRRANTSPYALAVLGKPFQNKNGTNGQGKYVTVRRNFEKKQAKSNVEETAFVYVCKEHIDGIENRTESYSAQMDINI